MGAESARCGEARAEWEGKTLSICLPPSSGGVMTTGAAEMSSLRRAAGLGLRDKPRSSEQSCCCCGERSQPRWSGHVHPGGNPDQGPAGDVLSDQGPTVPGPGTRNVKKRTVFSPQT